MPLTKRSAETSSRPADEKITVNLGVVDLGQIDLLVGEGFYGNRTDLIRTAIRNLLARHADTVNQVVARKTFTLGIRHITAAELRAARTAKQRLQIRVLGLAAFAPDVSADLAAATIDVVEVLGALHASAKIKAALAGRIR
jgi:Arc/MetJ-type ribon-helix-helix transcriptional regulator